MTETFTIRPTRPFGTFKVGESIECKPCKTPYGFSLRPIQNATFTRCPDLPLTEEGTPKSSGRFGSNDWKRFELV